MLENEKVEAQQALDELFREKLLPFKLSAAQLEPTGNEECQVRFYDSRLHSVNVSWLNGQRFRDAFRTSVLARVERVSRPMFGIESRRRV